MKCRWRRVHSSAVRLHETKMRWKRNYEEIFLCGDFFQADEFEIITNDVTNTSIAIKIELSHQILTGHVLVVGTDKVIKSNQTHSQEMIYDNKKTVELTDSITSPGVFVLMSYIFLLAIKYNVIKRVQFTLHLLFHFCRKFMCCVLTNNNICA